jgi:peptidyl-dipeptidase Dcp
LLDKMLAARTFGAGFATVEFTSSALVDMAYHSRSDAPENPLAFEAQTLERIGMPDAIAMRHRTPHFQHIFSGDGYSAGYYSYLWSEVLDADAFAAFEETGDPFNPELAEKLRRNIYASGGSADPEELYTSFRGKMPTPDAMLKKRGLLPMMAGEEL